MVELGRLKENPTENLASPRVSKPLPTPLSVSDVHTLLAAPAKDESPEGLRDQAMLQLLYASGMRVSQLVSLNLVDLDWLESTVRCSSRAAGSRCIPVPSQVMDKVKDYVDNGRNQIDRNSDDAVFLNQRGDRLTRQGFWLILKGYAEKAGLGSRVTPHTLRHSFAVHKLDGGADLHDVQQLLGHTHILSTKVYQQVRTPV
jgi:integrase/recombinase XerD